MSGNTKINKLNETFWLIFKQCVLYEQQKIKEILEILFGSLIGIQIIIVVGSAVYQKVVLNKINQKYKNVDLQKHNQLVLHCTFQEKSLNVKMFCEHYALIFREQMSSFCSKEITK